MIATVEKTICSRCGDTAATTHEVSGGDRVCDSCLDDYGQCSDCGETIPSDDLTGDDDGDRYCYTCYCERYTSCCHCGRELTHDAAICTDDGDCCDDCADDGYTRGRIGGNMKQLQRHYLLAMEHIRNLYARASAKQPIEHMGCSAVYAILEAKERDIRDSQKEGEL